MSTQQANTGVSRMRSVRNSLKLPLTAPQVSTTPQVPSTTSHVSLFLTNLRLLDLDQEADWPGISPATFHSKDAAGGMKHRIQSVEWALYHLFELWDGEETRTKLRPFFPPADQVQSINLRAALLRNLEQVKKNGLLGRDAVLRKTMLDECKGERFEEVLAVFSSAVLKKLVAERALNAGLEYRPTISEKIALENYGYSGERTQLNALLLAHKVSLRKALKGKVAARNRYKDFEDLVASKQHGLVRRQEHVTTKTTSAAEPHVSDNHIAKVRQTIKDSWTGNDRWVNTILHNDTGSVQGGLLAADFDALWPTVRVGKVFELEDSSTGLLEQLDQRVELQRSRVEKWRALRQNLFGGQTQKTRGKEKKAVNKPQPVDLGFHAHKNLQPSFRAGNTIPENGAPEYVRLISSLKNDLDEVRRPKIPDFSKLRGAQAPSTSEQLTVPDTAVETISDLSEWEDEPEDTKPEPKNAVAPNPKVLSRTNSQLARPRLPPKPVTRQRSIDDTQETSEEPLDIDLGARRPYQYKTTRTQPNVDRSYGNVDENAQLKSQGSHSNRSSGNSTTEPKVLINPDQKMLAPSLPEVQLRPEKHFESEHTTLSDRAVSPTQAMADEILASMSNASPSPAKKRHTLSLAERTRMTMTRTKSYEPDDDMDPNLLSPSVAKSNRRNNVSGLGSGSNSAEEEDDDLIARTRRSMAGIEAAKQKAQLERMRSQRSNQTVPRKDRQFARVVEEDADETSIIEELLETQEVDAEAVFRSRPKMRTSPAPSPHRRWNEEEYDS